MKLIRFALRATSDGFLHPTRRALMGRAFSTNAAFRNIFAFGLFVSPIQTFRRITRTGSTEQFSGLPYIYALLSCLTSSWYGSPLISADNVMVMTVNSVGAVFQLVYIILFIAYAEKAKKVRMLGLLVMVSAGMNNISFSKNTSLREFVMPSKVDTNVGRIAVRLGWVPLQPLPESLQLHLLELYPMLESIQQYSWPRLCKLDQKTL